jgi:hypothetical protein
VKVTVGNRPAAAAALGLMSLTVQSTEPPGGATNCAPFATGVVATVALPLAWSTHVTPVWVQLAAGDSISW